MSTFTQGQKVALAVSAAVLALGAAYILFTAPGPAKKDSKKKKRKSKNGEGQSATDLKRESISVSPGPEPPLVAPEDETAEQRAERLKGLGNRRFSQGQYAEAVGFYTQAIEACPAGSDAAKYYANRAACHAKLKNFDDVIADCTAALSRDPKYVKAWHRRAQAYEAKGDLENAIRDHVRTMTLQPANQQVQSHVEALLQSVSLAKAKAKMAANRGKFPSQTIIKTYLSTLKQETVDESEEELLAQLGQGSDAEVHYKLGLKYITLGEFGKAQAEFTNALKADPNMAKAHMQRGTLQHLSGDVGNALISFGVAASLDPNNSETYVRWGNAFIYAAEHLEGRAQMEKAISVDPNNPVAYFHAAQCVVQLGDPALSLKYFDKVLELDPNNYMALNHKGLTLMGTENGALAAMECFQKAIQLKPNEPDAYNSFGLLLRSLEQAYCNLAICYLENQVDKAIECYDKAIDLAFFEQDMVTIFGFREAAALRKMVVEAQGI